ncbi:uncharacterized protein K460DRAFT_171204 [Cucurbitaria berberidis CBS 394.84]|uniref:Uncharacterized protein n=1 Tax=Cucurbitaria berberidis CBS 394.84 TaxID=1168544 RepID=A0A9P4L4N0_9PLEO|nr:uncharacterized protein K460DRAFT_171204 [Cucurbitaria berberidis CBS 394.84]KAF1841685.1 hypothetical protein K460DRAFT_171204 [Cucurbitaria berberidis CBS 394.84]
MISEGWKGTGKGISCICSHLRYKVVMNVQLLCISRQIHLLETAPLFKSHGDDQFDVLFHRYNWHCHSTRVLVISPARIFWKVHSAGISPNHQQTQPRCNTSSNQFPIFVSYTAVATHFALLDATSHGSKADQSPSPTFRRSTIRSQARDTTFHGALVPRRVCTPLPGFRLS